MIFQEALLPAGVAEEIADGSLQEPFAWFGMHKTEAGMRVVALTRRRCPPDDATLQSAPGRTPPHS
jgi:hypothetical protein